MLISICGKSGSGKSTLAKKLKEEIEDSVLLDIDNIAHNIYNIDACKEEMIKHFGEYILTNNEVNRKILSKIVFQSKKEMQALEDITWKYMERIIDYQIEKYKEKVIILEWINLPKTKYLKESKIRILLDTPDNIRKERVLKRDNITEEDYEIRNSAALTYKKKDFNLIIEEIDKETIERIKERL